MVIDKYYNVLANNEMHYFITSLTEVEFLKTLDATFGSGNYIITEEGRAILSAELSRLKELVKNGEEILEGTND